MERGFYMDIVVNSSDAKYKSTEALEILKDRINFVIELTPNMPKENIKLVFTDCFTEDVETFQSENNISEVGHSDGAVAKVCEFENSKGDLETTVFFDLSRLPSLLKNEISECIFELHIIQHEFGHICDDYLMKNILPKDFHELNFLTKKEKVLYILSQIAWTEFQANNIGMGIIELDMSKTNSNEQLIKVFDVYGNQSLSYLSMLPQQINEIKEEIRNTEGNSIQIQTYTKNIIYHTSLFISVISAFRIDEKDNSWYPVYREVLKTYKEFYFQKEFEELLYKLKNLQQSYPNWEDFYTLEPITIWVEKFWRTIGIEAEDNMLFRVIDEQSEF